MKVRSLGHVVLKVRDQQRSEAFYHGLLGIPIAARYPEISATFFTLGDHHDLAVIAVGEDAQRPPANATGLAHFAFKIGDKVEELQEAKRKVEAAGIKIGRAHDHGVTKSIYFEDPDGNTVELYVDVSDAWKQDPQLVAQIMPLEL